MSHKKYYIVMGLAAASIVFVDSLLLSVFAGLVGGPALFILYSAISISTSIALIISVVKALRNIRPLYLVSIWISISISTLTPISLFGYITGVGYNGPYYSIILSGLFTMMGLNPVMLIPIYASIKEAQPKR